MSKLVDKLKNTSQGGAAPIGFKSAALPKLPPLLLIGEITLPTELKELGHSLDAVLLKAGGKDKDIEDIKQLKSALGDVPYGAALKSVTEKTLAQLKEASCDFVVLTPPETSASLLLEEDLGKIVVVDPSWPDINLRTLESLPVDAILVESLAEKSSLSLQSLLELRRFSFLTGKPLIVRLSYPTPGKDLSALLSVQARALLIPIKSEKDVPEISRLRSVIENLPRTKPKKPSASPFIPSVRSANIEEEEEDEGE